MKLVFDTPDRGRVLRDETVIAELARSDMGWWATWLIGLQTTMGPAPLDELVARLWTNDLI